MYDIVITKYFKKRLKPLAKKDPSLKDRLKTTLSDFTKNRSTAVGRNIFKIRVKRQTKGKSGGYRLYIFLKEIDDVLSPVYIFAKSSKENITQEELTYHLNKVADELESI